MIHTLSRTASLDKSKRIKGKKVKVGWKIKEPVQDKKIRYKNIMIKGGTYKL